MHFQSLCPVFFLLTIIKLTFSTFLSNYFKLLDQNVINLGESFAEGHGFEFPLRCVSKCPVTEGCDAVSYDSVEKKCIFYNWKDISLAETSTVPQSTLIVNTGILMFHVTGNDAMSSVEAAGMLCQQFDAELATVSDLYDARDGGYHLCRCGWISDATIRFVIQTLAEGCDSYDIGVISCKDLTSSTDAYCKFR